LESFDKEIYAPNFSEAKDAIDPAIKKQAEK